LRAKEKARLTSRQGKTSGTNLSVSLPAYSVQVWEIRQINRSFIVKLLKKTLRFKRGFSTVFKDERIIFTTQIH
jgi:hypothetical protein